jgi:hypothetical protein
MNTTSSLSNPNGIEFGNDNPPFEKYFGQSSFFGGTAPLDIVYGKQTDSSFTSTERKKAHDASSLLILTLS